MGGNYKDIRAWYSGGSQPLETEWEDHEPTSLGLKCAVNVPVNCHCTPASLGNIVKPCH